MTYRQIIIPAILYQTSHSRLAFYRYLQYNKIMDLPNNKIKFSNGRAYTERLALSRGRNYLKKEFGLIVRCGDCETSIFVRNDHLKVKNYCSKHSQKGKNHPLWKGSPHSNNGYLRFSNKKYYHRIIIEQYMGRKLKKAEVVHHINSNTKDNRIENLMLFPNNVAHMNYHREIKKLNY